MKIALCVAAVSLLVCVLPSTAVAGTCSVRGVERKLGPTYVTSLSTTGVSCSRAKDLVRAYHRCRFRNGGKKGRCTSRVSGYRCTEKRGGIQTQFSGKVTCKSGSKVVRHTYTQFT